LLLINDNDVLFIQLIIMYNIIIHAYPACQCWEMPRLLSRSYHRKLLLSVSKKIIYSCVYVYIYWFSICAQL